MNWFERIQKRLSESLPIGDAPMEESMSNFTPRAQQALALARKEADRFNHNFVGTEHLLLGLIKLGQGVAVNVIQRMGLDLETVRMEVEKQVGTGPDQKMLGNIPYTPRVKKVLALAQKEAKALNHKYVGTEHILLGLLREGDGVAALVFKNLGVDIQKTRQMILEELDPNFSAQEGKSQPGGAGRTCSTRLRVALTQGADSPLPATDLVDTSKRYDVFCSEHGKEVVYRNVLFKGSKRLLPGRILDALSQFIELEDSYGSAVFVARTTVIKFCEHVPTSTGGTASSPPPPEP
jgi:ATP-dependent Clp protease ATP-binding subunit ClpA